jgi:hypothetical protein
MPKPETRRAVEFKPIDKMFNGNETAMFNSSSGTTGAARVAFDCSGLIHIQVDPVQRPVGDFCFYQFSLLDYRGS